MMIADHGFATRKFFGYSGQWVDVVSDATREHEASETARLRNSRNLRLPAKFAHALHDAIVAAQVAP